MHPTYYLKLKVAWGKIVKAWQGQNPYEVGPSLESGRFTKLLRGVHWDLCERYLGYRSLVMSYTPNRTIYSFAWVFKPSLSILG